MSIAKISRQALAIGLAAQIAVTAQFATLAQAEVLSTDSVIAKYGPNAEREFLLSELQRDEIRDQIIALGVDPEEAERRLSALSDTEIASMLMQFDAENAGGDGVLSTLLTVFVILLITDFLCLTKIFKFTRCV